QPEGAVGRRGAKADEVGAPAQPLAQLPLTERWDPHIRHQVAPDELGEHARVDAVGLARQRRERLYLARLGDLDLPAARSEPVTDPDGTAHHLDAAAHVRAEPVHQLRESVLVSWNRALDDVAGLVDRAPRRLAGAPVDTEILHLGLLPGIARVRALILRGRPDVTSPTSRRLHDSRSVRRGPSRPS